MSEYNLLDFKIDGAVATITLNRPEAANAFNLELATELNHAAAVCHHTRAHRLKFYVLIPRLLGAGLKR